MAKRPDDKNGDLDTRTKPKGELGTLEKPKTERPPLYEVLLHNDDYTTQEFVVYVLMKFFQHDATAARKIMLHVHTKGIGVAGVFPFEIAETKAHQVVAVRARARDAAAGSLRKSQEHEHAERRSWKPAIRQALDDATRRAATSSRGSSTCCWRCSADEKTAEVIKHCGGSVARLQRQAGERSWRRRSSRCPRTSASARSRRWAFARVVQRAVNHVLGAGKSEANGAERAGGDVLRARVARGRLPEGRGDHAGSTWSATSRTASPSCCRPRRRRAGQGGARQHRRRRGRGGARRSAGRVRRQPERAGARRRDRSADRPRARGRARAARAGAAAQEQPAVRRRRRRRQDRHRRGAGAADRARRGARRRWRAPTIYALDMGAHGGRHALPRRLRGALQGGDQGAAGEGRTPSSSSTSCTPSWARARRRAAPWTRRT